MDKYIIISKTGAKIEWVISDLETITNKINKLIYIYEHPNDKKLVAKKTNKSIEKNEKENFFFDFFRKPKAKIRARKIYCLTISEKTIDFL